MIEQKELGTVRNDSDMKGFGIDEFDLSILPVQWSVKEGCLSFGEICFRAGFCLATLTFAMLI